MSIALKGPHLDLLNCVIFIFQTAKDFNLFTWKVGIPIKNAVDTKIILCFLVEGSNTCIFSQVRVKAHFLAINCL